MSAPSEVHRDHPVKILDVQRLATDTELNSTLEEVTNSVKLEGRMYQAATRMNVFSPVMINIAEVDGLHFAGRRNPCYREWRGHNDSAGVAGSSMIQDGFDVNLGDPLSSWVKSVPKYAGTSRKGQGLADDLVEVGLTGSTRSMGEPCTGGSGQQRSNCFRACLPDTQRLELCK